jgi:hypothetical protein
VPPEPAVKRTDAFIDGQNLFHAAPEAIGYTYPNYDVRVLADRVCAELGWQLAQTRSTRASLIARTKLAGTTSGRPSSR